MMQSTAADRNAHRDAQRFDVTKTFVFRNVEE